MQPTTIIISALALLLTPTAAQINYCRGFPEDVGYCTTTSFVDKTSTTPTAPTTSECQDTCRGVLTDAGDWGVTINGNTINNMLGWPCGLRVGRGAGEPNTYSFRMHNQDLVDILNEASLRFGPLHSGKVAAEGTMVCDGHQAKWYID